MASNINYLSINENFPVAGQDNDTQVFRDNFDTIKTSFRNAKEEITALQDGTAKLTETNDFQLNNLTRAVLVNNRTQKFPTAGDSAIYEGGGIDYENGAYQMWKFETGGSSNSNVYFDNLPGDPSITPAEATPIGMGKMTLELYSDGSNVDITFTTSGGAVYKTLGFPTSPVTFPTLRLSSATDPVIVEVWRHRSGVIFMHYVGQFA
jgi:hypothetical protein